MYVLNISVRVYHVLDFMSFKYVCNGMEWEQGESKEN